MVLTFTAMFIRTNRRHAEKERRWTQAGDN